MQEIRLAALGNAAFADVRTDHAATSTGGRLCSVAAAGCVIIVLHDPHHHNGCLAHLSPVTAEAPVIQALTAFLVAQGAAAANVDTLLAGAGGRPAVWRTALDAHLTVAGLDLGNVRDHTYPGPNASWGGVAFDPTTSLVASIPPHVAVDRTGRGAVTYAVDPAGALTRI